MWRGDCHANFISLLPAPHSSQASPLPGITECSLITLFLSLFFSLLVLCLSLFPSFPIISYDGYITDNLMSLEFLNPFGRWLLCHSKRHRLEAWSIQSKTQVYLSKNLRISCLAIPSSSHVCANFILSCSAFLLISSPFSLRHRSTVCRISIPTASRVPSAVSPFLALARGLRPFSPVLTWKSSKATLRFSVRCAAAAGWSAAKGQQILRIFNYQDEL